MFFKKKRDAHEALLRAAERARRAFQSKKAGQLRQGARAAQQQRNWPLAEQLYRESLATDPGDRLALIGLASALIYIGKNDEAARLTDTITGNWPGDENGCLLRARLAEAEGDHAAAIVHWRAALAIRPNWTQALTRLGQLLANEREFTEARACAARLSFLVPDNPAGDMLRAHIETAEGHRETAAQLRRTLAERFPRNTEIQRDYGLVLLEANDLAGCQALIAQLKKLDAQHGLWLEGRLLAASRPGSGHTNFWRQAHEAFPGNTDFVRKYLHAALDDARLEDALAGIKALIQHRSLRVSDASYVVGIVNLLEVSGDRPATRAVMREFLKSLKGSFPYRLSAIRLSRLILRSFPKTERSARLPAERLLRMIQGAPVHPRAASTIRWAAAIQSGLRAQGGQCLFDIDIFRSEADAFVSEVRARLAARQPFAFIRIGDAEANALPYETGFAAHAGADADQRETMWWGRTLDPASRARLNARVLEAMLAADALALPDLSLILRDIRVDPMDQSADVASRRGIFAALRAFDEDGVLRRSNAVGRMLTSTYAQYDLARWDLYKELFAGVNDAVAVSCHATLPGAMKALFGTTVAQNIVIPPRHASLKDFGMSGMGPRILPEVLDDIIEELDSDLSGRLVIVGAGYAGKCIIRAAQERGGVALDLGSILDYWLGIATRSYQTAGLPVA